MKLPKIDQAQIQTSKKIISTLFLDQDGKPFQASTGQAEIFTSIVSDFFNRVVIKATTQYGKSDVTAMAIIYLCITTKKKIALIAPSGIQMGIIMEYIRNHCFDNDQIIKLLDYDGSLDRFRRERSKTRIDFKHGGSIFALSADAKTTSKQGRALMGFGANVVVVDESALIPDSNYAKILRMIGGVKNGKLVQLSNPFFRNHFFRAFQQDRYYSITIDYKQALKEGRLTQEFLDEAKETIDALDWQIFYECKFPDSDSDSLILRSLIDLAIENKLPEGPVHFGGDIARFGGDNTVGIIRRGAVIKKEDIHRWGQCDLMETVGKFKRIIDSEKPESIKLDVVGVGSGVVDRLIEESYTVNGVNVGSKPSNTEKFSNLRAEIFWGLRQRFEQKDISIPNDTELVEQLANIKYSFNSRGQVVIEGKEQMKKRGMHSPDEADALALAFYQPQEEDTINITFA